MAEGGRPIIQNIHVHVHASSLTDETTIHGDQVGTKMDVAAGRIGAVNMPGPNAENAGEEHIVEGVEEMNLAKNPTTHRGAISKPKKSVGKSGRPQPGISADSSSSRPEVNKAREVRIGFLKERCYALLGQSQYIKAAPILEEIISLEETVNFNTCLLMAECYLHLGREIKASKAMQAVRDIIMTSQSFTADDIYELGSELVGNSSHIRGIILLRISADMYETNASTPDDVVNGIYSCISKTDDATAPLIEAGGRSRVIGLDIGVENMIDMNQRLNAVKNAKPENKALKEARSNNWIGYNLNSAGETEKSIKYRKTGVDTLERQLSSNAAQYHIYGDLLYWLGIAYDQPGSYSEAETYFAKAITAFEEATDDSEESTKQKNIKLSKKRLNNTCAKLGK